jgi:hypothetical protein
MKSADEDSSELRQAILPVAKVELELVVDGAPVGDRVRLATNSKNQQTAPGDSGGGGFLKGKDGGTSWRSRLRLA